jgi:hypothetical protein
MARQSGFEDRESGWRDLAWAGVAATLVTLLLVLGVGLAWLVGSGPGNLPALTASEPHTPTPRALMFLRSTPAPVEMASAPEATVAEPTKAKSTSDESAKSTRDASFEASSEADFLALASGPWAATADGLANEGDQAEAERWLTLSSVSSPRFAVEAEIRVTSVLDTVCDQSFGITGGSPDSGQVFGGGVIFPCSGEPATARLTDVTTWEDGYNADAVIAEKAFTPGDKWRTYRFELRGDRLRLLVDGVGVVSGSIDPSIDPAALDAEAGLWSQGIGVEVRRVAIYPLPE